MKTTWYRARSAGQGGISLIDGLLEGIAPGAVLKS